MFAVNEGLDKVVIKPVAQGYDAVTPLPVKVAVGNFFGNIWDCVDGNQQPAAGQGS
jgi:phospholipid-binding lipoprotein MlaA